MLEHPLHGLTFGMVGTIAPPVHLWADEDRLLAYTDGAEGAAVEAVNSSVAQSIKNMYKVRTINLWCNYARCQPRCRNG